MGERSIPDSRVLHGDDAFVLSRLSGAGRHDSCLLLAPASVQAAAELTGYLRHALSMRSLPVLRCVARPRELTGYNGHVALILDDPGGVSLAAELTGAWPTGRFLRVASNLAAILGELHRCGVIAGDVRPGAILVDSSDAVALAGLGLGTRMSGDGTASSQPAVHAGSVGSVVYIAPEQTGRMNHPVDWRCDLYSLGVILYQMLTGHLPFAATTAIEWIHCHMATRPVPVVERVAGVPPMLSAIVMQLLAKTPADRYQSAAALEADLRRCLQEWEQTAAIQPFELSAGHPCGRLAIPKRLYGREADIASLKAACDRVSQTGHCELVLISGYSGIGKSALVRALQSELSTTRATFASGKFDQYKRDIPYATFAEAFQAVIRHVLSETEDDVVRRRAALRDALGANGQLLTNLIPGLELLVGPQTAPPELPTQDAQTRFHALFRRFVAVFAQPHQPLILFLDDLQWLDAATLDLLTHLVTAASVRHLLIIGAYRDNEVSAAHPLVRALADIRRSGTGVTEIVLKPLGPRDVAQLTSDAMQTGVPVVTPLAQFVHEKTGGNPFFVIQLLTTMVDDGQIAFDPATGQWSWGRGGLRTDVASGDIVELLLGKLARLPESSRTALKYFSCLGDAAQLATLAQASGMAEQQIDAALGEAGDAGLVSRIDGGYRMVHDRVREAAYALLPPGERAGIHLRIGRVLAARATHADLGQDVFEIVNQLNRAIELVVGPGEREQLAALNLVAGRRAKAATAYASALNYFAAGSGLLGDATWEANYPLAFALDSNRAECEFLTGATERAKEQLLTLGGRAANLADRATIAWLRVTLFTALDRSDLAVELCLDYLREVGIHWSAHPTREQAVAEYEALLQQIGNRPVESLLDLPLLTDVDRRATLDVLTAVLPPAFFSDENLVCLVLCRMANLSLAYGNSDASSLGYAYLGMIAGPCFNDYNAGFQFGKLGLALVDERGLDRFRARVYMCFAYHVSPWTRHIRAGLPLLYRAFDAASESGDLTYMGFSACTLITSLLAAGEDLAEVERKAQERLDVVVAAKFGLIVDIITGQLRLIRALRGEAPVSKSEEAAFEQHLESDHCLAIANCWYWIRKMQAAYVAGDTETALGSAEKAAPLLWTSSGHFEIAEYHFYALLTRARLLDAGAAAQRAPLVDAQMAQLMAHQAQLSRWAEHCPKNFACRASLANGEIARIGGNGFEAMRFYESAIAQAKEQGFAHIEALAHEVAAAFYEKAAFAEIAPVYWRNACLAWRRWGAMSRAEAIGRRFPAQPAEAAGPARPATPHLERLDLAGIVEAAQAISSELGLDRLIRTLMSVMLEHAGAQRGVLVMPRKDALWIAASATTGRDGVWVELEERIAAAHDLPMSVLLDSIRTQDYVLIGDAQDTPIQFTGDEYLRVVRPRSLLCLPLVRQARLIGALFLENNLAPGVFTPSRVAVLRLLASQAAISLENASLQEKEALLEEKEALLKEVHHRVKNNLQFVSSLLNLQASRVTDPAVVELFSDSRNRVRAMALVHENLYSAGNFARIPMATHVERLCGHLARAYDMHRQNVALRIEVDDIQLDMNAATSCGLVINELVSNALKHAFAPGRGGQLRVSLTKTGEDGGVLTVSDDGVGMPAGFSLDAAASVGLQLVGDLAQQMRGTVHLNVDQGTQFIITFSTTAKGNR